MTNPFEDALSDLRISGSVLLNEGYASPWAVSIPESERLKAILNIERSLHVMVFHYVLNGGFNLEPFNQPPVRIDQGQIAICASGFSHIMREGHGANVIDVADILTKAGGPSPVQDFGTGTSLLCGVFVIRALPLNPLTQALPDVLKLDLGAAPAAETLRDVARLLIREVNGGANGGYTSLRLLEIFCAEALRRYQQAGAGTGQGWFRLLADTRLTKALAAIHGDPAQELNIAKLAEMTALSPSRFAARFKTALGQSVMSYVARIRANRACRLLLETQLDVGEVGVLTGYESLPVFSRSFKALIGESPVKWRHQAQGRQ